MGGGISVTQIPMHIDKETFRKITGGTFNDPIFDDHCVDGVMSRDKLLALSQTTDCFLSFDRQQQDCHGRNNMTRAQRIQNSLRSRGIVCWLLEEQVPGCSSDSAGAVFNANKNNITHICKGIDNTRCVICLVTNHYVTRVFQSSNTTDQCQVSNALRRMCSAPILILLFLTYV